MYNYEVLMKVIIAGSRTITDFKIVYEAIKRSGFKITEVVCGECRGPDMLGAEWAKLNREAENELANGNQIVAFMRSGSTISPQYTDLQWMGD